MRSFEWKNAFEKTLIDLELTPFNLVKRFELSELNMHDLALDMAAEPL